MRRVSFLLIAVALAACARTLPEHDNRIFTATPVAKLSAADLVRAFDGDAALAADRFIGRAVEVSGVVRDLPATPSVPLVFLLSAGETGRQVRVSLHEDRSAELAKTLANGHRVTLRCFCEAVTDHVQLKSCVVP